MGAGRPREDREIIDGVVKEFLALCAVPHGPWREGTLADLEASRVKPTWVFDDVGALARALGGPPAPPLGGGAVRRQAD